MVPVFNEPQFEILNQKIVFKKFLPTPNFDSFIAIHDADLVALPEFISCHNYFKKSPIFQNHLLQINGTEKNRKITSETYSINNYLIRILSKFLNSIGYLRFEKELFNRLYSKMEDYLFGKNMDFIAITPLKRFQSNIRRIDLGQKSTLSAIEISEVRILLESNLVNIHGVSPDLPIFALKTSFSIQKNEQIGQRLPIGEIEKIISNLRIFKRGSLSYNNIYCIPTSWEPIEASSFLVSQLVFGPPYILQEGEVDDLLFLNRVLDDLKTQNKFIEIAIERFNFASTRRRIEDRLTDYITALEALMLSAKEKSELVYRLSLRIPAFIGKTGSEKTRIKRILKTAYTQRSCIVHGKKIKLARIDGKKYSTEDLTSALEDYTRKTIKKFCELTSHKINQETFLEELDDRILCFERDNIEIQNNPGEM